MSRKDDRIKQLEQRNFAAVNDMMTKRELEYVRGWKALGFILYGTAAFVMLSTGALIISGVTSMSPSPALLYANGLLTGVAAWRATVKLNSFRFFDRAWRHGGAGSA